jgi:hypothetical protein
VTCLATSTRLHVCVVWVFVMPCVRLCVRLRLRLRVRLCVRPCAPCCVRQVTKWKASSDEHRKQREEVSRKLDEINATMMEMKQSSTGGRAANSSLLSPSDIPSSSIFSSSSLSPSSTGHGADAELEQQLMRLEAENRRLQVNLSHAYSCMRSYAPYADHAPRPCTLIPCMTLNLVVVVVVMVGCVLISWRPCVYLN